MSYKYDLEGRDHLTRAVRDLSKDILQQKEKIIFKAITHVLGDGWVIEDTNGRCTMEYHYNEREVFLFDGIPMVEFYPPEYDAEELKLTSSVSYLELY